MAIPAPHRHERLQNPAGSAAMQNIARNTGRIRELQDANAIFLDRTGGGFAAGSEPGGAVRCARVKGKPGKGMTLKEADEGSSVRWRHNPS